MHTNHSELNPIALERHHCFKHTNCHYLSISKMKFGAAFLLVLGAQLVSPVVSQTPAPSSSGIPSDMPSLMPSSAPTVMSNVDGGNEPDQSDSASIIPSDMPSLMPSGAPSSFMTPGGTDGDVSESTDSPSPGMSSDETFAPSGMSSATATGSGILIFTAFVASVVVAVLN